ncbi:MAG: hypothetical protein WCJ76_04825 [Comamonadaceae bacterium]
MNASTIHGAWWVWLVAAGLYIVFRLWYDNWRGPLSKDEVEHFMRLAQSSPSRDHTDTEVLRAFLEKDDGKEFVMCNLVKLHARPIAHPVSGEMTTSMSLIQQYFRPFLLTLLLSGGHPVLTSRKVAGYVDSWNTSPDPGWTAVGMMRYRSRRDAMRLTFDKRFQGGYPFKIAAIEQTFSFPTQVISEMVLRPRGIVALALALLAALAHLASLLI